MFYGGVTADGYTTTIDSGSGQFILDIDPASVIRKAFLFVGRHGNPMDMTINFNSTLLSYSDYTMVSPHFLSAYAGSDLYATTHVLDITNLIIPSQNIYQISVPIQSPFGDRYTDFYLIVCYENNMLPLVGTSVWLNDDSLNSTIEFNIDSLNFIDTTYSVALSIYGGYMCDTSIEKTTTYINSIFLGEMGGNDYNTITPCGGVVGYFSYKNHLLFGLGDDNPDYLMNASDGLSNIQSISSIMNSIQLQFVSTFTTNGSPNSTNSVWGSILTYTTPCDTFTSGIDTDTLMDLGDSTLLSVYGGYKYKWQPSTGLSCDTCAITWAKPDSSTLYTCRIYNNDSCSKVLPVKVNIYNNISIDPTGEDIKLHLYPNPAIEKIIVAHSSNQSLEFMITNIQGIEIKKAILESLETSIEVSTFSPGIYFLQVKGGNFRKALRFIKQ